MKLRRMYAFSGFFRSNTVSYSTVSSIDGSSTTGKSHSMVDYLILSLQFSKQDAISVSSKCKITHLNSTINSDLVVNVLTKYGLDISQIREIVSSVPKILTCDANKTLEPKIRYFQEFGIFGSNLVNFIKKNPEILGYGLHTRIIPNLIYLRKLLGSDEIVIKVINRLKWLSSVNRLSANVSLLKNYGLLEGRIVKIVMIQPRKLVINPVHLENRLHYVEEKLRISRDSPNFLHAVGVVLWCNDSDIEKKMQIFKSFGWSDLEVSLLFRAQPYCLGYSEANIHDKLKFLMKDLGYAPSYLMRCHNFFTLSLDKRVIPRSKILKILKEKKLVNDKTPLISIVSYSELKFLDFLRGFESDIPDLCETYMNSVKRVS